MPIYEYTCPNCGKSFEKIKTSPTDQMPCPDCGGAAQRSVSVFSSAGQPAGGGCGPMPGSGFG
ncbi:MAG: zinc ribbon domain-containing protein [Desulfuromonas sp.]|nr:MAG: zinc ribbon domain-containing protein [Desulfuromonas sp.]